jgi:hypothetical protein
MAGANAASVLIVVPIDYVMTAVFNAPVAAIGLKDFLRIGLLRSLTGDAVSDFTRELSGFFVGGLALDDKGLADVRKIKIVVEPRCCPDFTYFNAAVVGRVTHRKIGFLSVGKVQCDVLKKSRLIVFRDEEETNIPILLVFESVFVVSSMGTDNKYAPIEETTKTNPNPAQYRYISFFLVP